MFIILTSWESALAEICERWSFALSYVRVKFVTHDAYRMVCPIESEADFQHMCHIYHMFNCTAVDLIVDTIERPLVIPAGTWSHFKYCFVSVHILYIR